MDQQPKIPTLKDSQKKEEEKKGGFGFFGGSKKPAGGPAGGAGSSTNPQLRIRGLASGTTLVERLKQFKKKDLAFILAGLGTLMLAPLAEHFMMSPDGADGTLQQGWGGKGASGFFGSGGSPYEPGTSGLAPGSAIGGGADVITPLNARDPSALVMGPGATQQPPTNSVAPATPPTRSDSDYKDALAASARGLGAAASKAPVAAPKLGGSGLRGLAAVAGGSSASGGLAPVSSAGLAPNTAAQGGGGLRNVRAMPGYGGVAARGPGKGGGGFEDLRKAAGAAGELMNRGGAASALDQAAAANIPKDGAGFGGNGAGGTAATDKGFGGNQDKNSKQVGESLEFLKRKAMQEKRIEMWAKEQEANNWALQTAQWRNKAIESMFGEVGKGLGGCVGKLMTGGEGCFEPDRTTAYLCPSGTGSSLRVITIDADDVAKNREGSQCGRNTPPDGEQLRTHYREKTGSTYTIYDCGDQYAQQAHAYQNCSAYPDNPSDDPEGGPRADGTGIAQGQPGAEFVQATSGLRGVCSRLDALVAVPQGAEAPPGNLVTYVAGLKEAAKKMVQARDTLVHGNGEAEDTRYRYGRTSECGAPGNDTESEHPVLRKQWQALRTLEGAVTAEGGLRGAVSAGEAGAITQGKGAVENALTKMDEAQTLIAQVEGLGIDALQINDPGDLASVITQRGGTGSNFSVEVLAPLRDAKAAIVDPNRGELTILRNAQADIAGAARAGGTQSIAHVLNDVIGPLGSRQVTAPGATLPRLITVNAHYATLRAAPNNVGDPVTGDGFPAASPPIDNHQTVSTEIDQTSPITQCQAAEECQGRDQFPALLGDAQKAQAGELRYVVDTLIGGVRQRLGGVAATPAPPDPTPTPAPSE